MVFLKHFQKRRIIKYNQIKNRLKWQILRNLQKNWLTCLIKEVNELAKILKDEYGIEPAAAAVAVAARQQVVM